MTKHNHALLPIVQSQPSKVPVLHTKYLVSLLGPGEDPDDPYYAGDIYGERVKQETTKAKEWREET
jgi:hypothetical protein